MRKLTLTLSTAALALGGAGIAYANHHGSHNPDANGDGVVSLDEATTHAQERFARMDANGDGQISAEDRAAHAAERFAKADANGDGEITPAEMTAARESRDAQRAERRAERQARMFERLDTDGSGGLSQAELRAGREAMRERRGERGEMRRGGRRGGGHGMAMLRRADANGDKIVTQAEFDAAVEARFARVDTDNSGTITAEEREAARETMRSQREERRERRRQQGASE